MYICDSSVVVTGIASCGQDAIDASIAQLQTLRALRQLSHQFDNVPLEQLEKALSKLQAKRGGE